MLRRRLPLLAPLVALALTLAAVALLTGTDPRASRATEPGPAGAPVGGVRRPNIVYVLTDDLSRDLLPYMPAVQAMERRGTTFGNFFVSDSLCCPSRSTIFTGDFPHDTGVFTNVGGDGGITAFYRNENENRSFNVYLQDAGYQTAFMGKYLNGYLQGPARSPVPSTYVPPGWNEWDAAGYAYPEFDYTLNENGSLHHFGHARRDYLTDVLARRGSAYIRRAARSGQPFFLELASFAPHQPYTPAPRDRHDFPGLTAPRPRSYDVLPTDAPRWLAGRHALTPGQESYIDEVFRRRAQSVQALDGLLTEIRSALRASGQLSNTYIVFNSDNGLHTGEYRLMPGKLTAFDTDIHVPLVVDGPGIRPGTHTDGFAENTDLAPTFERIAGTSAPCDGHALQPLFSGGRRPAGWRNAVLVEHHGPDLDNHVDPDAQSFAAANPTTYEAVRTPSFLHVEYRDGEREFYDLRDDRAELHNVVGELAPDQLADLHRDLAALENCHTAGSCWSAEHVGRITPRVPGGQAGEPAALSRTIRRPRSPESP